jgi:hypothetical protein
MCLDVPIDQLTNENFYAVGCIGEGLMVHPDHVETVPTCHYELNSPKMKQAGGHEGTFLRLGRSEDGRIGKVTEAFDHVESPRKRDIKHRRYGLTEYGFYMQQWCLQRLADVGRNHTATLLAPFALQESFSWSPNFFGVCRVGDGSDAKFYMAMEDVLAGYQVPSMLDLKVGTYTVEPESTHSTTGEVLLGDGFMKRTKMHMADKISSTLSEGARPAGFKIWDEKTGEYLKMENSDYALSVRSTMQKLFSEPSHASFLPFFTEKLHEMYIWWITVGSANVRFISGSLLFAFDAAKDLEDASQKEEIAATLKMIDYAHAYSHKARPTWKEDGVALGVLSALRALDNLQRGSTMTHRDARHLRSEYICGGGGKSALRGDSVDNPCDMKCPPLLAPPNQPLTDTPSSFEIANIRPERCEFIATSLGVYKYFSWNSKNHVCRMCNARVSRSGNDYLTFSDSKPKLYLYKTSNIRDLYKDLKE